MSFGLIYWILMLLWFVFALFLNFGGGAPYVGHYGPGVNTVMLFILFLLLGWKVFGPPVHP